MKKLRTPKPTLVKLDALNFASYNPRVITDREMTQLKLALQEHGIVTSLVVQKKGLTLIGGHQRVRALRELCIENKDAVPDKLWAIVLDVDDKTARRMNVALNKVSGEFDEHKLGELFTMLGDLDEDQILAMGFEGDEVLALIENASMDPLELARRLEKEAEEINVFAKSVTLTVEFDTVQNRDLAKELLKEKAAEDGVKAGNLVLNYMRPSQPSAKKKASKKKADRKT